MRTTRAVSSLAMIMIVAGCATKSPADVVRSYVDETLSPLCVAIDDYVSDYEATLGAADFGLGTKVVEAVGQFSGRSRPPGLPTGISLALDRLQHLPGLHDYSELLGARSSCSVATDALRRYAAAVEAGRPFNEGGASVAP